MLLQHSFRFLQCNIHYDPFWASLLARTDVKAALTLIESDLSRVAFQPAVDRAFHFLTRPKPKVIILGQDPYSTPNKATGRAFEVAGLTDWSELDPRRDSFVNVLLALSRTYHRINQRPSSRGWPVASFPAILSNPSFHILPPGPLFNHWESEGVLLLNTALTVTARRSGLHLPIWAPFINQVVRFLDEEVPDAHWFLWGSNAQGYGLMLRHGIRHEAVHPSPRNANAREPFDRNDHFYKTSTIIDWFGPRVASPSTSPQGTIRGRFPPRPTPRASR